MSLAKSFTAVGAGPMIAVLDRGVLTYAVSGTFVATINLQQRVGKGGWTTIASVTSDVLSGTITAEAKGKETLEYRFTCSAFTSGTAVTSLTAADPVGAIGAAQLLAGAVTKTKLAGGFSKISVVDGEDETTTHQITVTGMAAGDEVVAVLVFTAKAVIATLAAHGGTLTAAAGKITPGTEVDNTSNQYVVFWNDLT